MSSFRHEYKYMIDARQEAVLRLKADAVLSPDSHADAEGSYLIRSLYFDDQSDTCLWENLSGTDPRSKFRIRYYNDGTDRLSLEKKSKVSGMTRKESCPVTAEECTMLSRGALPPLTENMPEMKRRLFTELFARGLTGKAIVTYRRIPFVYAGGNVRITFDREISSSSETERFLTGDYAVRPILPAGRCIMEVKWDELLPQHIRDALLLEELQWTAFSKYAMCRRLHL